MKKTVKPVIKLVKVNRGNYKFCIGKTTIATIHKRPAIGFVHDRPWEVIYKARPITYHRLRITAAKELLQTYPKYSKISFPVK